MQFFVFISLLYLGRLGMRRFTVFGTVQIASLLMAFGFIFYNLCTRDGKEERIAIFHFLTLNYFYTGVMWTIQRLYPKVLLMAKECDTFVGLDSEEYRQQYEKIMEGLQKSKMIFGSDLMNLMVHGIAMFIAWRPMLRHVLFGAPRELVLTGQVPDDLKFWSLYSVQFLFMLTAGMAVGASTKLQMRIVLHIFCKYKLLNHVLAGLRLDPHRPRGPQILRINRTIKLCAIHYEHVLSIFREYKKICGYSFNFIYFGLLGSITLSRTALTGEHPDFGVFPEFVAESTYIFYFCLCLNDVSDESDRIVHAIYDSDWLEFPPTTIRMLRMIGIRTWIQPLVPLFRGGSAATLQTYGTFMNASMAYFMSAMIF